MRSEFIALAELAHERDLCASMDWPAPTFFSVWDKEILLTHPPESFLYARAMLRIRLEICWLRLWRDFPPFVLARWICERLEERLK